MFSETNMGGGSLLLFFIGLIILFSVFTGNGIFGGLGNRGAVYATETLGSDKFDRLLETMLVTNSNTNSKVEALGMQNVQLTSESTIAQLANNNQQTRDVISAIAGVNDNINGMAYKNLEQKNIELAAKVAELQTSGKIDYLSAQTQATLCGLSNQITALASSVITKPEFMPLGGIPALGCVQQFPRTECGCGC